MSIFSLEKVTSVIMRLYSGSVKGKRRKGQQRVDLRSMHRNSRNAKMELTLTINKGHGNFCACSSACFCALARETKQPFSGAWANESHIAISLRNPESPKRA